MPAESRNSERVRSPADFLRLIVAAIAVVLVIVVAWLFGDTVVVFAADLLTGVDAVPDWMLTTLVAGIRLLAIAVLIGGLLWTAVRERWAAAFAMALGIVIGGALVTLLEQLDDVDDGAVVATPSTDLGPITSGTFPTAVGIGMLAAALTAGAPWLSRSWRRMGWVAVIGLVLVRTLTSEMSFGSMQAVLVGWFAGAAALVITGAPARRADADSIAAGLATVGLPITEIKAASVDARGSTPYFAVMADGGRLFVKVLGRDERSADLMFRMYRRLQRRDLGDERPFSSLRRAVEHEALLALAARDLGIRTPRLRALAVADPASLVLAYDAVAGRSLDQLDPSEVTDEVLLAIWEAIGDLRRHGIAHRDLRLANVFLGDDGAVWIIDFGFSEMAASDLLLANDVAELVCSSSVYVGAERAAAPALATVDRRTLDRAVERLRPWALSGATRTAVKQQPTLLADLRRRLAR
jgi:tRNA A-37 threonylcarbamoyl transferase component Bud32